MSSTEQAVRVTAQGEFGQLQRGLKDLQSDLKNVLGEVDKGARRGGMFDDTQLRALDVYRRRFKETLADLDKEFEKQADSVDALNAKMKKAYAWEREELKDQIKQRRENLDVIDRTRRQLEQTYQRRNTEAQSYGSSNPAPSGRSSGSDSGSDSGFAMLGAGSVISRTLGAVSIIGKFALGLAGVGSLLGMATEAYQLAHTREIGSLDLAQRLRGNGFSGSNTKMYDDVGAIGRSSGMGYSQAESWQLQEAYTSEAGELGAKGQEALQKFSRGYGLDATTVGSMAGNAKQLGGVSGPKQFADMIATSVEKSGMTPRILEVMKTSNTLLQNLNTSFKDGSTSQIIAYQTTLDRLGNENGMTRLTGAQGANVIGGLGGIYQPDNDKWKWMGITGLQKYNPDKYSKMGLYDLESSFEDGMQNKDNIPAMAKYLKETSGGDNDNFKRMMQGWLMDGGFKATKSEVTELDKVTDGFTAFDPDKIDKVLGTDSGAKYDTERKGELGQHIMDVDAEFSKNLEKIGQKMLPIVTQMKSSINDLYGLVDGSANFSEVFGKIVKLFEDTGVGAFVSTPKEPTDGTGGTDSGLGTAAGIVIGGGIAGRLGVKAYERFRSADTELIEEGPTRSRAEQYQRLQDRVTSSEGVGGSASEGVGTRFGRFVNKVKGLGKGTNTLNSILSVIPAGIAGYEAEKENPDAPFIDKLGSALEKLLPFDWNKTNFSAESMGDSDMLSTTSTKPGSLANLSKMGVTDILDLSTKGKSSLEDLKTRGLMSYTSIEQITAAKFDEIKQIHKNYYDLLGIKDGVSSGVGRTAGNTTEEKVWNMLADKGLKPGAISGIMGNINAESSFDPKAVNPSSGAYGVGQWLGGRLDNLKTYAKDLGKDPSDLQTQIDFLWKEFNGGDPTTGSILNSHGGLSAFNEMNASDASSTFEKSFERSGGALLQERAKSANGYFNKYGSLGTSVGSPTGGVFRNWQSKITSKFGANRGDHEHSGLDIDGEQGDPLNALAGGRVTGLTIDDGSQYDNDAQGKGKNTNMGGTEMMVTMPDGSAYSYSHMSKINPGIFSKWFSGNHDIAVNAGDNLGSMGGDIDEPGSGSSTTGSHLHLGYRDANGVAQNPEDLLNSLNAGDSSILGGNNVSSTGQSTNAHITVDVNLSGDKVSQLNNMTAETLKSLVQTLVQQGIEAYKRQQMAMNPTVGGW